MRKQTMLVIACLALVGCTTQTPKTKENTKICSNPAQCEVKIVNPTCGLFRCTASVDFEHVEFQRNVNNFKVTWTLPAGFGFCDTAGDGVWLKKVDPHEQFEKPSADKPSGKGLCKFKEFQLKAKNTKSLPDPKDYYEYKIIFHDEAGEQIYVVDPYMMNQ
jgi:hypothetical protein